MNSTNEMFKELGFKGWLNEDGVYYEDTNGNRIYFNNDNQSVIFCLKQKEFVLDMKLLNLIEMKCKEIGWLNETE